MDEESHLDDLLRAAFEDEAKDGESILESIERMAGTKARVLLRDAPDHETPVLRVPDREEAEAARGDLRYQVLGEIARGGIGVVVKGRDRNLGRNVALKILRKEHAGNEEVLRRFVEEAQIGGQLQHPGIVPVYGLGLSGDDRPYFAMKLVKGETLSALLEDRKDVATERRKYLAIFEQVAQTVAYAHARGVVHRDLKPSNVMVGAFGEVLVVDWGLAKVLGREEPATPKTTIISTVRTGGEGSASLVGSVMGTPAYMPPEQALGQVAELDERSDVFSLGAILTEILTGEPPYEGDTRDQIVQAAQARLEGAFARLDSSGADAEILDLTKRCLAPVPKDRPRDAGVVAREIAEYLAEAEARALRAEVEAAEERARAEEEREKEAKERHRVKQARAARRRTLAIAAAILFLVAAGGAGWFLKDRADRQRAEGAQQVVAAALRQAMGCLGARDWEAALSAARKAVALAETRGANDRTIRQAGALLTRVVREKQEADDRDRLAAEDAGFLAKLEEIRLRRREEFANTSTGRAYKEAFRRFGIDLDELGAEAVVEKLLSRSDPQGFAAFLDDMTWRYLMPIKSRTENGLKWARHLVAISKQVDPDPWRDRLREAALRDDVEDLRVLGEEVDPADVPARTLDTLAVCLGENDPAAVVPFLRRAWEQYPDDHWISFHLGLYLSRLDPPDREEVVRFAGAAVAAAPWTSLGWGFLGTSLLNQGRYGEAIVALRRSVDLDPKNRTDQNNLCAALIRAERWEEAEVECRRALDLHPNSALVHNNLGLVLREQGNLEEALAEIERACDLETDSPGAWSNLGWTLKLLGNHERAVEAYEKAIEVGADWSSTYSNYALSLNALQRYAEAEKAALRAITLEPGRAYAWGHLGRARLRSGNAVGAEEALKGAIELMPDVWSSHDDLGLALRRQGKLEEALAAHRRAIELAPYESAPHVNIGALLCDQFSRYDDAIAEFEAAIRLDPECAISWRNLGVAHRKNGDEDAAIEAFRKAHEFEPEDYDALEPLATLLFQTEQFRESAERFRAAAKIAPNQFLRNACLHNAMAAWSRHAVNLGLAGDYRGAIDGCQKVLELDPKSPLMSLLAWYYVACVDEHLRKPEEGLRLAEKAFELAPEEPMCVGTLGCARYLTGNFAKAVELIERCVEIYSGDPPAVVERFFLAMAYYRLGRKEDARKTLAEAVRLMEEQLPEDREAIHYRAEAEVLILGEGR